MAIEQAKRALTNAPPPPPPEEGWQARASLSLFAKLCKQEVQAECARVEAVLSNKELWESIKKNASLGSHNHPRVFHGPCSPGAIATAKPPSHPLKLHKVFGNRNPVELEVCSGHGDWLVERAGRDASVNWVGLEMRPDRVHLIWAKAVCARRDNVAVLGGTAHEMLRWYVRDGSISRVFVNYPDPPVWHGSRMRLIDEAFLREVHRVLAPRCCLVIVTDDAAYAKIIIHQLERVPNLFRSVVHPKLYLDGVPTDYGSSYFDRMWANGRRTDRYYIEHVRLDA